MKSISKILVACIGVTTLMFSSCNITKKSVTETPIKTTTDTVQVDKTGEYKEVELTNSKSLLAGEWTMLTVDGKEIITRERPFITFDFSNNRFYGNNGCNVVNGNFECDGATLKLSEIITTMMSCDNETSEYTIMKALNDAVSVKLLEKEGIMYLHFLNSRGRTVATLKEQHLNFMNGAWTVEKINDEYVDNVNVELVIDLDQMTLHGNSGCNIVNGGLFIDYAKDWGVQFVQLVSTMKMCENMKTETALLIALESTETCKQLDDDRIALYDNKDNCVAVLKRLYLQKK